MLVVIPLEAVGFIDWLGPRGIASGSDGETLK